PVLFVVQGGVGDDLGQPGDRVAAGRVVVGIRVDRRFGVADVELGAETVQRIADQAAGQGRGQLCAAHVAAGAVGPGAEGADVGDRGRGIRVGRIAAEVPRQVLAVDVGLQVLAEQGQADIAAFAEVFLERQVEG